jgi:hypothetical protein
VLRERACLIGKPQFNFSRSADLNPSEREDCASAALSVESGTAQPGAALAKGGCGPIDPKHLQSWNHHAVVELFWHSIGPDAR